jgi:hypothetical protein
VAAALLGNPVVGLAYGADPGRLNQLGLLDRHGRIEQLGLRQVRFTGGSATVGSITSMTQPLSAAGDRTGLIAASGYAFVCSPEATPIGGPMLSEAGDGQPVPMTRNGWREPGSARQPGIDDPGLVTPSHSMSTIGG